MTDTEQIVLAIETTGRIPGVSLFINSFETDFWVGDEKLSASQSLLPAIFEVLRRNHISLSKVTALAVSKGPGSFTGVRIGLATAKGLSLGVKLKTVGISTLEALAFSSGAFGKIRSIISGGRNEYFVQDFYFKDNTKPYKLSEPHLKTLDNVLDELRINTDFTIISDTKVNQMLAEIGVSRKTLIHPENLARYVGLAAFEKLKDQNLKDTNLEPEYVRQADFEKIFTS